VKTLILLVVLLSNVAFSDSLYTGAWSYHFTDQETVRNETHNLLAYEHKGWIVGTFNNSYKDQTFVFGKKIFSGDLGVLHTNLYVGIDYGYKECKSGRPQDPHNPAVVCPAIIPEFTIKDASFTKYQIKPAIIVIGNALALSVKSEF
jgi:hypothetical protein